MHREQAPSLSFYSCCLWCLGKLMRRQCATTQHPAIFALNHSHLKVFNNKRLLFPPSEIKSNYIFVPWTNKRRLQALVCRSDSHHHEARRKKQLDKEVQRKGILLRRDKRRNLSWHPQIGMKHTLNVNKLGLRYIHRTCRRDHISWRATTCISLLHQGGHCHQMILNWQQTFRLPRPTPAPAEIHSAN